MPSIDENREHWQNYNWPAQGDEWSAPWTSSRILWHGTVLPRIMTHLPTKSLLEIAPGHGRLTEFLLPLCDRLVGVDIAAKCVEACERKFGGLGKASFHLTDGKSLDVVEDDSITFAISWDSLVHADTSALEGYVHGLASKLVPGAYGFIHHSNLGAVVATQGADIPNPDWRDPSMSADAFRSFCRDAGLECRCQELFQWRTEAFTDCFSLLRRPLAGEQRSDETRRFDNWLFREEMSHFNALGGFYGVEPARSTAAEARRTV